MDQIAHTIGEPVSGPAPLCSCPRFCVRLPGLSGLTGPVELVGVLWSGRALLAGWWFGLVRHWD